MVNLTRNHPRKHFHHSANYLHSPKAQAFSKMFTKTPHLVLLGLNHTHTHSLSLATLQWKLDRSPGAAESSGVQPRASHHKALPCYPKIDLLISFPSPKKNCLFASKGKKSQNHQIRSYLAFPWSPLASRRSLQSFRSIALPPLAAIASSFINSAPSILAAIST
jgi:hypothetical protein